MFSELEISQALILGVLALLIITLLATIAVYDAMTWMISWQATSLLVLVSIGWSSLSPTGVSLNEAMIGGLIGTGSVYALIVVDKLRKRKLTILQGDAWLFGASGILLGPLGLAIAMMCYLPLGMSYRFFYTRKRNRSLMKSYAPMAPFVCTATALVFGFHQYEGFVR